MKGGTNLVDSLSQNSKHSDDMHDNEGKSKHSYGGVSNKPKFVKTTQKLPDLSNKNHMASYEENKSVNHGKNSFPSDNEEVYLLSIITIETTATDKGRGDCLRP